LVHQFRFYASFVYRLNTVTARRSLWTDLRNWSPNSPWLILGDFNSLLSQADKHHGEPVSNYETADFRQCCSDLGLTDLNYSGCHFTWSNGRVRSKLDRALVNPFWSFDHSSVHVHFDNPRAFSDHSPATVSFHSRQLMGKKSFKFFNMWSNHAIFLELVTDKWHYAVQGSPMFIFCKRLKHLKGPLRELNNLHYSHISERVPRAEAALDAHQTLFSNDRGNTQLHEADMHLRQNLLHLKAAKQQFFSQKLKCKFFKESDKGTSFFHALMNRKHGQNFIPAIQRSNGSLTSFMDVVGAAFVDYYSRLPLCFRKWPSLGEPQGWKLMLANPSYFLAVYQPTSSIFFYQILGLLKGPFLSVSLVYPSTLTDSLPVNTLLFSISLSRQSNIG